MVTHAGDINTSQYFFWWLSPILYNGGKPLNEIEVFLVFNGGPVYYIEMKEWAKKYYLSIISGRCC
jgi:hypothetical protein